MAQKQAIATSLRDTPRSRRPAPWVPLLVAATFLSGCRGLTEGLRRNLLPRPQARSATAETSPSGSEPVKLKWHEYVLARGAWLQEGSPRSYPEELRAAQRLYRAGQFAEAAHQAGKLAEQLGKQPAQADLHRQALFLVAESWYADGKYQKARDAYEQILEKYPGTPEATQAAARLYTIADHWLDAQKDERDGILQKPIKLLSWWKLQERPWIDADGHALKVLEYVQERDPGNPVADEAVLRAAEYYLQTGRFHDAALQYDLLIQGYPKSSHLPEAHVKAAEARLASYHGPEYDGRTLDQAGRLLQAAATQFPELSAERPRLYEMLALVQEQKAQRDYETARFYERVGQRNAARVYYQLILRDYPQTRWAERARQRLEALGFEQEAHPGRGDLKDLVGRYLPELIRPPAPPQQGPRAQLSLPELSSSPNEAGKGLPPHPGRLPLPREDSGISPPPGNSDAEPPIDADSVPQLLPDLETPR